MEGRLFEGGGGLIEDLRHLSLEAADIPYTGGLFLFQTHLRRGRLFNLALTMVSILHKELEY